MLTESYNTFLGYNTSYEFGNLSNATAVGANAYVSASDTLVLGSINGVNGATGDTTVVIGSGATSSGAYRLDVQKGFINSSSGFCIDGDCIAAWSAVGGGGSGSLANGTETGNVLRWDGTAWTDSYSGDILVNGINIGLGGGNISSNTVVGSGALASNTTGYSNTANGMNSLRSNTTGYYNTANGMDALYNNTTGHDNTANGEASLRSNTTGNNNTANGNDTLLYNTTGDSNTANGNNSLLSNITGSYNTALGVDSLRSNTTGSYNTVNGYQALYNNITGSGNVAFGSGAGYNLTTGTGNIAI